MTVTKNSSNKRFNLKTDGKIIMTVKKIALEALFISFAAALSALETLLPPIVPIAGIRVGLGNIVTLFILYVGGCWRAYDAYIVAVLRCFLAALITGSLMSALYGLVGGIFACSAMIAARAIFPRNAEKEPKFSTKFLPFTGVCGAVFHIAGQMIVAILFYGSKYVLAYTPIFLASAIIGGAFTGICTMLLLKKLPKKLMNLIKNDGGFI